MFIDGAKRLGGIFSKMAGRSAKSVDDIVLPSMEARMAGNHGGYSGLSQPKRANVTGVRAGGGPTIVQATEYNKWTGRGERLDRWGGKAVGFATGAGAAAASVGAIGGLAYMGGSAMQGQVNQHGEVTKALSSMRSSLRRGGRTRPEDFEYNPIMSFGRPRVRGGHMGATGGLTLALNNQRTR